MSIFFACYLPVLYVSAIFLMTRHVGRHRLFGIFDDKFDHTEFTELVCAESKPKLRIT